MKKIRQQRLFAWREVRTEGPIVYYKVSRWGKVQETVIPYEEIIGYKVTADAAYPWLMTVGLLALPIGLTVALSGWMAGHALVAYLGGGAVLLGAAALALFYLTKARYWRILGRNGLDIYLYQAIPDERTVSAFIADLLSGRDAYLLAEYGALNPMIGYERQVDNLKFLRAFRVLDEEGYRKKEAELNRMFKKEERPIGFFA